MEENKEPQIDQHECTQLIFDKGTRHTLMGKGSSFFKKMVLIQWTS